MIHLQHDLIACAAGAVGRRCRRRHGAAVEQSAAGQPKQAASNLCHWHCAAQPASPQSTAHLRALFLGRLFCPFANRAQTLPVVACSYQYRWRSFKHHIRRPRQEVRVALHGERVVAIRYEHSLGACCHPPNCCRPSPQACLRQLRARPHLPSPSQHQSPPSRRSRFPCSVLSRSQRRQHRCLGAAQLLARLCLCSNRSSSNS